MNKVAYKNNVFPTVDCSTHWFLPIPGMNADNEIKIVGYII